MKIFKIISAVPMEHYKNQKGYDTVIEKEGVQIKFWMSEAQYQLAMFIQEKVINRIDYKEAEKLLDLIEEFGQEKYCEGSDNEAYNSEDI